MAVNAVYASGESLIPQTRSASAIEPAYSNGLSGYIPLGKYAGSGGGPSGIETINGVSISNIGTRNGVDIGDYS